MNEQQVKSITHNDLALFNKTQEKNFSKLIKFLKSIRDIPICIQISHSEEKDHVSSDKLWKTIKENKTNYFIFKLKKRYKFTSSKKATSNDIKKIISQFENTAKRAIRAGFDGIEIHMAHGYLIHQFLSPICNIRDDEYGGSLDKRCRLA